MSTAAQLTANRANSRLSTGPLTPESKAISSRNNLRRGFRSQTVLLPGDDPAEYEALHTELSDHFPSGDLTELRFVREMADAEWRLRRLRESLESSLTRRIGDLTPLHPDAAPIDLQALAIETLGTETGTSYGTWLRYETKFKRQYGRAYKDWSRYQNDRRRVSEKEADIWMKKAIFAPLPPGSPSPVAPTEGQNAAAQLRELSAQAATRAAVVRGSERDQLASTVQNPAANTVTDPNVARALLRAASTLVSTPVVPDPNKLASNVQNTPAIPRSAPCPCGSGVKFKRCCGKNAPPVLSQAA